ncbi:MAG TPA: TspO/MBR family protein [Longimicrobium sp.]|nr:TspO/MBR family protein [Longimicrobium sp.]
MGTRTERGRSGGRWKGSGWALAGFGAAVVGAAVAGSLFTPRGGRTRAWYDALDKPSFTPPKWAFPVAWTALYTMIAASGYRVWRGPDSPARSRALALWRAQLGLNAAWTPLFFGAKNPEVALGDIGLLLPAIAAYANEARKVDAAAGWLMAPYLGWVGFATALNTGIVRRNPHGLPRAWREALLVAPDDDVLDQTEAPEDGPLPAAGGTARSAA